MTNSSPRFVSIPDRRKRTADRRKIDQSDHPIPAHSIHAEQSLIGALLIDNARLTDVLKVATEQHIYRDDHRRIFGHIRRLIESGRPADIVTVFAAIEAANEVEQTGGLEYLGDIANGTPSAANVLAYARVVREQYIVRMLADCGARMAEIAATGGMRLPEQMEAARQAWRVLFVEYRKFGEVASRPVTTDPHHPQRSYYQPAPDSVTP